ncbi:MAG TPA: hypothetical protein VKB69_01940, partial [Micromonosporaceae bacterium]|nr:hypothetical protein [Micromonosporaceae bacterium]
MVDDPVPGAAAGPPSPGPAGAAGPATPVPPPPVPGPGGGPPPPPPGYVWVYPTPYQPPPPWRAPRWLKITTAVWAVAVVVAAAIYSLHGRPTVREQTSVGNARPVVDAAVADVVSAAGPGPVVAVSGFASVGSCRITAARSGASFGRTVDVYTAPGGEPALLRRIVAGLPARYHAKVTGAATGLYADAGDYVALVGTVPAP